VSAERPLDILGAHMPPFCCSECFSEGRHTFGDIIESKLHLCVRGVLQPDLEIIAGASIFEDDITTTWRTIDELNPKLNACGVITSNRKYRATNLDLCWLVPQHHIERVVETL
jgi:hypothetical protein